MAFYGMKHLKGKGGFDRLRALRMHTGGFGLSFGNMTHVASLASVDGGISSFGEGRRVLSSRPLGSASCIAD